MVAEDKVMSSTVQLRDAMRQLNASLDKLAIEALRAQYELQLLVDALECAKQRLQPAPRDPAAERFLSEIQRQMQSGDCTIRGKS